MKFETLKNNHKSIIIVGSVITLGIVGAITILPSYAKFKTTQSVKIGEGVINYKVPDLKMVAMYKENESGETEQITETPGSNYTLNTTNSKCEVNGVKDSSIAISYDGSKLSFSGIGRTGTKCYVYFDLIKDTTVPTISNVKKTSTSKTSISVSVTASDNIGVTEYWYQIDSNSAVKGSGSTYTFSGLSAGTSHTIKV